VGVLVNLPVAAVAAVLTARLVPDSADPRGRRLDVAGIALGALALAATTFALIAAGLYALAALPTTWLIR
jgi:hypothetical protein